MEDGVFDGMGYLALVGAESDLTGGCPRYRATADGGTDAGGEDGWVHGREG